MRRRASASPSTRCAPTRCAPASRSSASPSASSSSSRCRRRCTASTQSSPGTSRRRGRRHSSSTGGRSVINVCDGTDETCPWRRNPPLTVRGSGGARAAADDPGGRRAHRPAREGSGTRTRSSRSVGHRRLHPELDRGRRRRHLPRAQLHGAETATRRRVVILNEKLAEQPLRRVRADRQVRRRSTASRSGDRRLPLHGELPWASRLGAERRFAQGDHPARDRTPAPECRCAGCDFTVKPRAGVDADEAIDDVTATLRSMRGLRPARRTTPSPSSRRTA